MLQTAFRRRAGPQVIKVSAHRLLQSQADTSRELIESGLPVRPHKSAGAGKSATLVPARGTRLRMPCGHAWQTALHLCVLGNPLTSQSGSGASAASPRAWRAQLSQLPRQRPASKASPKQVSSALWRQPSRSSQNCFICRPMCKTQAAGPPQSGADARSWSLRV